MPTGYTQPVVDGDITTLSAFMQRCAQAFIIDMREMPLGADIPMPSRWNLDYREQGLAAARKDLAWYRSATAAQLAEERDRTATGWLDSVLEAQRKGQVEADRYDAMTNQVQAWEAPKALAGLRDFMLSQLAESRRFDTSDWTTQLAAARAAAAEPVDDYRTRKIQDAVRRVDRETKGLEEAQEHYDHNLQYRDVLIAAIAAVQEQEVRREAATGA